MTTTTTMMMMVVVVVGVVMMMIMVMMMMMMMIYLSVVHTKTAQWMWKVQVRFKQTEASQYAG